jgi:serine/threonine-protein kinase
VTASHARDDPGVREGDVLAGKFRVDKVIGIGGMGVVVAAHHLQLDEKVALKFLLPHALESEEAVARFEREARAAVKIKSEHVARIIDVGALEDGRPYMVMEYLDGGDLDAWVRQKGPLDVEQAVEFVLQACEAIAEAHALGIVHRDLKPANLQCIRRPDGLLSVKVLDFGISKVTGHAASGIHLGITKTQSLMGSPVYMSPEQLQSSKNVDARTDIWSLGVILFELIAGRPPFTGETMPQLVLKVMSEPAPGLRELRPEAPEALERVIHRCLDKDLDKRYPNVAELAADLLPFGPERARASADRIARVIHAAGLSATDFAMHPYGAKGEAVGTVAPWLSGDVRRGPSKRAVAAIFGITAAVAVATVVVWVVRAPRSSVHVAVEAPASVSLSNTQTADAVPPAPAVELLPEPRASASTASSASAPSSVPAPPSKKRPPLKPLPTRTAPPGYDPLNHL